MNAKKRREVVKSVLRKAIEIETSASDRDHKAIELRKAIQRLKSFRMSYYNLNLFSGTLIRREKLLSLLEEEAVYEEGEADRLYRDLEDLLLSSLWRQVHQQEE